MDANNSTMKRNNPLDPHTVAALLILAAALVGYVLIVHVWRLVP